MFKFWLIPLNFGLEKTGLSETDANTDDGNTKSQELLHRNQKRLSAFEQLNESNGRYIWGGSQKKCKESTFIDKKIVCLHG